LNGVLPRDIAVRDVRVTAPDFDPRRHGPPTGLPLLHLGLAGALAVPRAHRVAHPRAARRRRDGRGGRGAGRLHDFATFQAADNVPRPSVRDVAVSAVEREGEIVHFRIVANAFVRHMVRNVVGQLVEVDAGASPPPGMTELLAARDRTRAAPTAPPHGLFLEWVDLRMKVDVSCKKCGQRKRLDMARRRRARTPPSTCACCTTA
jgi:tRNA pseudouridine38-40 synthase